MDEKPESALCPDGTFHDWFEYVVENQKRRTCNLCGRHEVEIIQPQEP